MSYENRKRMYDFLVAEGRFDDIDPALKIEFGATEKNPEIMVQTTDLDWSAMTKDQLKKNCDKLGLKYESKSTKDDLIVLLENKSDGVV